MIQPIAMSANQAYVAPVSFSRQNSSLNNESKMQSQFNSTSPELHPSVANSVVGQKLDFYA